jgi:outer membrane protein assembly factor BamB
MLRRTLLIAMLVATFTPRAPADDWPTFGRDRTRNSVSPERNPPLDWRVKGGSVLLGKDAAEEKTAEDGNIRWTAALPGQTHSTPVVSNGLVWIGAAYGWYSDGKKPGGSLCCFRESDGRLVYERRSESLPQRVHDPGWTGLGSSPLVEGESLWYVTNRWEVVCLDIGPLLSSKGPARERWIVDLAREFGVFPRSMLMGPPRHCSIAPSYRDRIFVTTGNGVDESRRKVPAPDAPAIVCLDKNTGKTLWTDRSPGGNVLATEAASPLVADIAGRGQVVVPQGDGWLRSFDPMSGKTLWQFDMNRKESVWGPRGERDHGWSSPVLYDGRIYVTTGQEIEHGEGPGRLLCIDPTKSGDISQELAVDRDGNPLPQRRVQAVIAEDGERAIANPDSGLVWEFDASHAEFERQFHRSISSVAAHDGLVVATDSSGLIHCLDAATGEWHWSFDMLSTCWTTPLIVGGYVLVADEDGNVMTVRLSADPAVALAEDLPPVVNVGAAVYASPVFANGTLYIASRDKVYAIGRGRDRRVAKAIFVPTPHEVVVRMLKMAQVTDKDLVVDLGSGDGRILIAAAKAHGAQAVGYEIDGKLVQLSRDKVKEARLEEQVEIREQDFFTADFPDASVVAAFLYPAVLEKLKPQFARLRPGTRIVTHTFPIPDAAPDESVEFRSPESGDTYPIYLYKTPLSATPTDDTQGE